MRDIVRRLVDAFWKTWLGYRIVKLFIAATRYRVFSVWTVRLMQLDSLRLQARRAATPAGTVPGQTRLHLGCGQKRVPGWLNVDLADTDPPVDLAAGSLPWRDGVFEAVASQHVIEHLELEGELIPLLREVRRVARPGAEIWVSCPDLEIVCRSYLEHKGADLVADRLAHATVDTGLDRVPPQHFINKLFNQDGEHRNLFDFELLAWTFRQAGFAECDRVTPADFLARFPEFPPALNDMHSIYVRAIAPQPAPRAAQRQPAGEVVTSA